MFLYNLSLKLKLYNGYCLVHALIKFKVILVVAILGIGYVEAVAWVILIYLHRESRKRYEIDSVALLQHIQISVFCR